MFVLWTEGKVTQSQPPSCLLIQQEKLWALPGFCFFFVWGIMSDRFLGGNSRENKGKREERKNSWQAR